MVATLTLSVDAEIVVRAKRWAKERGTTVSRLVEVYLDTISRPKKDRGRDTPVLNEIRGILRGGDIDEYREHLAEKYR